MQAEGLPAALCLHQETGLHCLLFLSVRPSVCTRRLVCTAFFKFKEASFQI